MKNFCYNLILAAFLFSLCGCSTYKGLAPPPPKRNLSRGYYYNTSHWPYGGEWPFVKIPPQFVAGLPAIPCIMLMTPVTVFTIDKPVLSKAVRTSERLYMETPGYVLYLITGAPFYAIKYCLWNLPIKGYYYLVDNKKTNVDDEENAPADNQDNKNQDAKEEEEGAEEEEANLYLD